MAHIMKVELAEVGVPHFQETEGLPWRVLLVCFPAVISEAILRSLFGPGQGDCSH